MLLGQIFYIYIYTIYFFKKNGRGDGPHRSLLGSVPDVCQTKGYIYVGDSHVFKEF